jgi:uncharacterized protein
VHPADRNRSAAGVLEMLIIQATPFCNIDCGYCYLPQRTSRERMREATLQQLFVKVLASPALGKELTVLWHAGEPLVAGIGYYERAFKLIDDLNHRGVKITHSIQTNGTLLNQQWIDLFRAHGVRIGVSLDGPAELHDRCRKTRNGHGTHERVMRGIELLQRNEYPFDVITVLTRESLACARELFVFFVDHGISDIAFNIEEVEGNHRRSSLEGTAIASEIRSFFDELFLMNERHGEPLAVREFSGALAVILGGSEEGFDNPQTEPLRIVTVGVHGELSTFSPELLGYDVEPYGDFVFGNVHDIPDLVSILDDSKFIRINADIQRGVQRCRQTCEYFEVCRGGAPANKLFENGSFDSTETMYCRLSKKAVIDVVLARAEERLGSCSTARPGKHACLDVRSDVRSDSWKEPRRMA